MNDETVKLNLIKLKIKAKSLAAEARIIRKEENKLSGLRKHALSEHRKGTVRRHARATFLAIAYLKGRPYKTVEKTCWNTTLRDRYIIPKVVAMVQKYGPRDAAMGIKDWLKA